MPGAMNLVESPKGDRLPNEVDPYLRAQKGFERSRITSQAGRAQRHSPPDFAVQIGPVPRITPVQKAQGGFEHSRITSTRCGWRRSDPAEPPPHVSDLRDTLVCRLGPGNPALVRVQSAGRSRSRDDPRRERVVSRIARAGSEVSRGPRPPRAGTVNLRPRAEDPVTTNRLEHGNRRHATVLTDRRPTREEVGQ